MLDFKVRGGIPPLYPIVEWLQRDTWGDTSLPVHNDLSGCRRQNFFGLFDFERVPSASISVYNNISACYRQKIFALKGPCHPLSYLVHNNVSACRRQNFFVLFGFERAHLSKSACCRQKFFGFERASSASLLILT